jgi:O-antigen/teichoic acid export membrane protein
MLIRHTLIYGLARGFPAVVSFLALLVYTRLLQPGQYGQLVLVTAGISMAGIILFQWLRLVAARWLPTDVGAQRAWLGQCAALFIVLALFCVLAGGFAVAVVPWHPWGSFTLFGIFLLISQQWLEMNLKLVTMKLDPGRYALLLGTKSILAFAIGATLAWVGWGAWGPLWGLFVASVVAVPLFGRDLWRGVRLVSPFQPEFPAQLRYGLPLIGSFALGWIIASSDRFIIGGVISVDAAGLYAVGYDLAQQGLGVALLVVQIASYPLVVRALEVQGPEEARKQLSRNGDLVCGIAFSGAAMLTVLAPFLSGLVGASYRETTTELLPPVALAAALGGIKAFHFDLAFHLDRRSTPLLLIGLIAASINIVLNFIWIPQYGLLGAAWATVIAFACGIVLSMYQGCRLPHMPSPLPPLIRGALCGIAAFAGASAGSIISACGETCRLFGGLICGGGAALACALVLNLGGCRRVSCLGN